MPKPTKRICAPTTVTLFEWGVGDVLVSGDWAYPHVIARVAKLRVWLQALYFDGARGEERAVRTLPPDTQKRSPA